MSESKSAHKKTSKDETYWKVLQSALELDFKKGHQKWTMSELSRMSGVTRSLIYYYFGRSRESLLMEAVNTIGEEVFGLSPERLNLWKMNQVAESALTSMKVARDFPFLIAFYFTHRFRQSPLGESIRRLEKKHREKVKNHYSRAKPEEINLKIAALFGAVLSPHPTELPETLL